jgi:DNA-binding HxlR family transcriptional regulator
MKASQSTTSLPDIFSAACPTRQAISRVADKWSILLLLALAQRPHHFGELRRRIDCISHKVLAQALRKLESDGFVLRTVLPGRVVKVRYELSPLGASLITPLEAMWQWAVTYGGASGADRKA